MQLCSSSNSTISSPFTSSVFSNGRSIESSTTQWLIIFLLNAYKNIKNNHQTNGAQLHESTTSTSFEIDCEAVLEEKESNPDIIESPEKSKTDLNKVKHIKDDLLSPDDGWWISNMYYKEMYSKDSFKYFEDDHVQTKNSIDSDLLETVYHDINFDGFDSSEMPHLEPDILGLKRKDNAVHKDSIINDMEKSDWWISADIYK